MLNNCDNCRDEFERATNEVNRSKRKGRKSYCSSTCLSLGMAKQKTLNPRPNVVCSLCDKSFYKRPSALVGSKSGLFFCCREHKDLAQRIGGISGIMPSHYGAGNGVRSYRQNALLLFPHRCAICGYDKYLRVLEVHHKDGDRSNNPSDGSNWQILCPTCHREQDLLPN